MFVYMKQNNAIVIQLRVNLSQFSILSETIIISLDKNDDAEKFKAT